MVSGPSTGYTLPEALECIGVILLPDGLATSAGMSRLKDIIVKVANLCNLHYRMTIKHLAWRLGGWLGD